MGIGEPNIDKTGGTPPEEKENGVENKVKRYITRQKFTGQILKHEGGAGDMYGKLWYDTPEYGRVVISTTNYDRMTGRQEKSERHFDDQKIEGLYQKYLEKEGALDGDNTEFSQEELLEMYKNKLNLEKDGSSGIKFQVRSGDSMSAENYRVNCYNDVHTQGYSHI